MKRFSYFYCNLLLTLLLLSCGGEPSQSTDSSEDSTNTETSSTESEETKETPPSETAKTEKMCFASEEELTKGYFNFIFTGDSFTGTASFVTPKAGMTFYNDYNIKGTRSANTLQVTLSLADSDSGQGIGDTSEETWYLEENRLVLDKNGEGLLSDAPKIDCYPESRFEIEVKEMVIEKNTYDYVGTIGANLKVVMRLNVETNPEDKQERFVTGYYYYEKSGANNKIQLDGSQSDMGLMPAMIYEVKDGKQFGKFVFEQGNVFGEDLEGLWVSADGSKELPARLQVR